jgi:type I restriction-modification system DNA methylase subunit
MDFKYIMDCLNDPINKKDLGAFYTPKEYCKMSLELVRNAIKKIPSNHDYVIIDRCAGTGNLEQYMSDEELAHTIVSTYELKE